MWRAGETREGQGKGLLVAQMGRSNAAPLRCWVRDLPCSDGGCEGTGASFDFAIGLGWRVYGGAGYAGGGNLSEGMRFLSWGHAGGRRRGSAADRRSISLELEWAHGGGLV